MEHRLGKALRGVGLDLERYIQQQVRFSTSEEGY